MESIETRRFGQTADGAEVREFTLRDGAGRAVRLLELGATVRSLELPARRGETADVVLGFDDVAGYESADNPYFGCTVGRCANRIARGRFTLDGVEYVLAPNDGAHHLHGGRRGFDRHVWRGEPAAGGAGVRFSRVSSDGEEGYPGRLAVVVTYTFTRGVLAIDYEATGDRPTPVNLTNHCYFHLGGEGGGDVLEHELAIDADAYTPVDDELIPRGTVELVEGTPLDLRRSTRLAAAVAPLRDSAAGGIDHNFVLRGAAPRGGSPGRAAVLRDPASGRVLEVWTTEPGLQLYTGNFLSGLAGKGGAVHGRHAALCLEAQGFPDAVHHPSFPTVILRPGETYRRRTELRFSAEERGQPSSLSSGGGAGMV